MWGISFPVMAMINEVMANHEMVLRDDADPLVAMQARLSGACFYGAVRFAAALVLLVVFLPGVFRGLNRSQWLMGMVVGLPFAAGFVLQIVALNEIPPSRSGFLTSLAVVFTPLLVLALGRRLPGKRVVVGAVLALLGTAVLTGACEIAGGLGLRLAPDLSEKIGLGDWLTILSALLFSVQILVIDTFSRAMPPERLTPGMFLVVIAALALASAAVSWWGWGPALHVRMAQLFDPGFWHLTLITSFFCTVLAFYLMNKYQGHLSPAHASLLYTLEPIFATLWAMLLPDLLSPYYGLRYPSEELALGLVVGGSLVLLGNVVALLPAA
jgi:drug/metabolite transporter (DMT)-like permease